MPGLHPRAFIEGELDGTNYTPWKFKITAILDSYELLEMVMGIDPPTLDPTDPRRMISSNAHLLQAWKHRGADPLCAMVTSTTDSVLTLIQHTSKASKARNILKSHHETQNQIRILNIENQFAAEKAR